MKLLDTTLRDGSYAINFSFSCGDVKDICVSLERMGFEYIEIGHGMGLNASCPENGVSLHSDLEYMEAANSSLCNSAFGFFCIPEIARLEDLYTAREHGASFVRIGINVDQVSKTEPYIKEAKTLGYTVMTNYMKSYAISPEQFAQNVLKSEDYGADYVYLVDSAGSMMQEDIKCYYQAIRKVSDIKLGFHGHDNLGLAVPNSIYCADLGFDLIDCSLQGLGRSSGNAATELLISVLKKKGYYHDVNLVELISCSNALISQITNNKLRNPLDIICGYAEFHTSYMKHIQRCSASYKVNPLELIIEYCKIDKLNLDYELLCKVAEKLPKDDGIYKYSFYEYIGNEQDK